MDSDALLLQSINTNARKWGLSPLLLLSAVEGIYSFRNVEMNALHLQLLDNLILSVLTLRIGEGFEHLAEAEAAKGNLSAGAQLRELSASDIEAATDPFFKTFAQNVAPGITLRRLHHQALQAAAAEIAEATHLYSAPSIGAIAIDLCKLDESGVLPLLLSQRDAQ